jgi:uncharacterized RDD family membrane protein YckC
MPQYPSPPVLRKLACLVYECLIIIAIVMLATLVFIGFWGDASQTPKRYLLQFFLWVIIGVYLIWHWLHGGQTLAMKTWGIALEANNGAPVRPSIALMRYLLVSVFSVFGFVWQCGIRMVNTCMTGYAVCG